VRDPGSGFENNDEMNRRRFLGTASLTIGSLAVAQQGWAKSSQSLDIAYYTKHRKFASLPQGKIAYVEYGRGPNALFLHGFPLNGYQWRGALERLHSVRRCIAPDLMSMGFSEVPEKQSVTPNTQAEMLASLLDHLHVRDVDLVANDSGGLVAQIFIAKYPMRVRSLLISNCDVDENNPPRSFLPAVALASKDLFTQKYVAPQVKDKTLARSPQGIGASFTYPDKLADETIDYYFKPLIESPLRMKQLDQYTVALGTNVLTPIREQLQQWKRPARIVWGHKDVFFDVKWADWLDHNLPGSRGVKHLDDANLFFPEEMPDILAAELRTLWGV
jgi:haloalkane dehalogenase